MTYKIHKLTKGMKFGDWRIVEILEKPQKFKCLCVCGRHGTFNAYRLVKKMTSDSCCKSCSIKKRSRKVDLTGMRFDKLVVLGKDLNFNPDNQYRKWIVKCDCGNIISRTQKNIRKTQSCGCLGIELLRKNHKPPGVSAFNALINRYKKDAELRGISFYLTNILFRELTNGNCFYCDKEPTQKITHRWGSFYIYNGIDRVDTDKGYTENNCVSCCKSCNGKKLNLSILQAIKIKKLLFSGNPYKKPL